MPRETSCGNASPLLPTTAATYDMFGKSAPSTQDTSAESEATTILSHQSAPVLLAVSSRSEASVVAPLSDHAGRTHGAVAALILLALSLLLGSAAAGRFRGPGAPRGMVLEDGRMQAGA